MEKGNYEKYDQEMETAFAKAQEEGTTISQWTNAAWRTGFGDGTLVGFATGLLTSAVAVVGGLAIGVGVLKFQDYRARRKLKKQGTT